MLREAVLMQAGQKDQFVTRSRSIYDGLWIVAGLDGMLRSMKQRREGEKEEKTHGWRNEGRNLRV